MSISLPVAHRSLVCACIVVAGCGQSPRASVADEAGKTALGEISEMYQGYALQNHKPPGQLADLKGFQIPFPRGHSEVASGHIVVRFGTPLQPAGQVLAYPKDAPQQGGLVLFNDGTIKSMTADELQAAIK